jgi:hypothetical protein
MNVRSLLIASVAGAAFVVVNIAPPVLGVGSRPALAKDDKDKGGDNGNRGGNAGGRESASAEGATSPKGKSASAPGHNRPSEASSAVAAKTPGLDAMLGGLHAANANLQAFIHASPNSRVGRIGAYAEGTVAVETAVALRDGAQAALDAATAAATAAGAAYDASIAALTGTYGYSDTSGAALLVRQAELAAVDTTTMTAEQLAAHNAEVAAVEAALAASADLAAAQLGQQEAAATLANAEQMVADAELAAAQALDAAANPNRAPVDPLAKAWVDTQLQAGGVFDYFRGLAATAADAVVGR